MYPASLSAVYGADNEEDTYTDDVPLALRAEDVEELAEVMDKARDLHPLRLAVPTDGLGGLE